MRPRARTASYHHDLYDRERTETLATVFSFGKTWASHIHMHLRLGGLLPISEMSDKIPIKN